MSSPPDPRQSQGPPLKASAAFLCPTSPPHQHTQDIPFFTTCLNLQSKGSGGWQCQPPGTGYGKGTVASWAPSDTSMTLRGDSLYPQAPPSGTWAGGTHCGLLQSPAPNKELITPKGQASRGEWNPRGVRPPAPVSAELTTLSTEFVSSSPTAPGSAWEA